EARRAEIEEALARMDVGDYGACEDCGEDIAPARLFANPTARLCVHCQADRESAPIRRCA
ncbi:MAG TPA: TraR/DksA C4-type zinc finger protein, partial [Humidesulfovibrio sp.]|uniref:TraR/DksA C4-type zinc finger protein n=1 Tax=Humidesulfovibrio sp. TaxID=2910988 RepID=UPI002C6D63C9